METIPYCIFSHRNSQKVCIHPECNISPFICNNCEDHYCEKLHNHQGGLNIIYISDLNKMLKKLNMDLEQKATNFNTNFNQIISKNFEIIQGNINRIYFQIKDIIKNKFQKQKFIKNEITIIKQKLEQKLCQELTGKQIKFFYQLVLNNQYQQQNNLVIKELQIQKQKTVNLCNSIKQLIKKYQNIKEDEQPIKLNQQFVPLKGKIINKKKNIQQEAEINFNQKKYDKAQELYQAVLQRNPQNIKVCFKLAQISVINSNFAKANSYLENIIKIDPTVSQAYYKLGENYQNQLKDTQAFNFYQLALSQDPNNLKYLQKIGDHYVKQQLYQRAETSYSQVLNKEFNIQCLHKRSLVYIKLLKIDEAFRDLTILVSKYPIKAEIFFQLGKISQIKDNYELAVGYYSNSINEDPFEIKYFEYRGAANLKLGKFKLAIQDFNKYLETNPINAYIYYLKATALIQLKQNFQALQDINMATDIQTNYRYLQLKAQIQLSLGMKIQSQRTMQQANIQKLNQKLKQF